MPTRKSALKRMRTDRKKGMANKSVRTELKTQAAKLRKIIEKGQKEEAASLFTAYSSKLDKAAKSLSMGIRRAGRKVEGKHG